MEPHAQEFLLEEYKTLRSHAISLVEETRRLETACAIAVAAILGWIATQRPNAGLVTWYAPALIPLFGGVRSIGLLRHVYRVRVYIRDVEEEFLGAGGFGWETKRFNQPGKRFTVLTRTALLFWSMLLALAVLAPLLLRS